MPWPNFLLIGSAKSGTTSLYHYLRQHPQIYMSLRKEPRFFSLYEEHFDEDQHDPFSKSYFNKTVSESIITSKDYLALFDDAKNEKAIGEASVNYLFHPFAPARIKEYIPECKLIIVLRNPFDAAYSHFLHRQRWYKPPFTTFLQSIELENLKSSNSPWSQPNIISYRFYDDQIIRYLKYFAADQFCVLLYEDLQNPIKSLRQIFSFLEVDEDFEPDVTARYNTTLNAMKYSLLTELIQITPDSIRNNLKYFLPAPLFKHYMTRRLGISQDIPNGTKCPNEELVRLDPILRPHILRLQDLIQRDLSDWLI